MRQRRRVMLAWLTLTVLTAAVQSALARTWTDTTGRHQIEAELIGVRDGTVSLRKADGAIFDIRLELLSRADREFLRRQSGSPAPPPITEPVAATIELASGAKVEGTLLARDETSISFRANVGGRSFLRKYPLDSVHAISIDGRREVVGEAAGGSATSPSRPGAGSGTRPRGGARP